MATEQVQKATIQPQYGARLTVRNQTQSVMTLDRQISWLGTPAGSGVPATIAPNGQAMFDHLSNGDLGSKAAVVYKGYNGIGARCAWVLAWEATSESSVIPNKVYVACGPASLIDNMSFNQIRFNLDAGFSSSHAANLDSKTSATANIHDLVPNIATVGANFDLIYPIKE